MKTKLELIKARNKAQQELDNFRLRPNIETYLNMPIIVDGHYRKYLSYVDEEGNAVCFDDSDRFTTNGKTSVYFIWQPDYDRPSLLNFRPVDATLPEHDNWLIKKEGIPAFTRRSDKKHIIYEYFGHKCLPIYENKRG